MHDQVATQVFVGGLPVLESLYLIPIPSSFFVEGSSELPGEHIPSFWNPIAEQESGFKASYHSLSKPSSKHFVHYLSSFLFQLLPVFLVSDALISWITLGFCRGITCILTLLKISNKHTRVCTYHTRARVRMFSQSLMCIKHISPGFGTSSFRVSLSYRGFCFCFFLTVVQFVIFYWFLSFVPILPRIHKSWIFF